MAHSEYLEEMDLEEGDLWCPKGHCPDVWGVVAVEPQEAPRLIHVASRAEGAMESLYGILDTYEEAEEGIKQRADRLAAGGLDTPARVETPRHRSRGED